MISRGDVIFTQLARNRAEGGLCRHLAVFEQLVRFFHHDHQRPRLGFARRAEMVGRLFPLLLDLAG